MRVVGGKFRGRNLTPFKGSGIRPTSDRAREAIFNVLGQGLASTTVLDIFAGTGALGIEALSRGAASAIFIDNSKAATAVISKNVALCGLGRETKIITNDVLTALSYLKRQQGRAETQPGGFDLIFLDAPYNDLPLTEAVLGIVIESKLVKSNGRIVCETAKKLPIKGLPKGVTLIKEKTYGDTLIYFLEAE